MLGRSIHTQTDHWVIGGEPHGPKVFFRCVTADSRVHQLKLSSDCALQVLLQKLPSSGPYEWHGILLDPRLTPSHYNMLPGEEHCVTIHCKGHAAPAGVGWEDSDKVRALNYLVRALEDEVESKNRILQQAYASQGNMEDLRDEITSLRCETEKLRDEKRKLTARIREVEEKMSYNVRAASPVVLDADREITMGNLKAEIAMWQAGVGTGKMVAAPTAPSTMSIGKFSPKHSPATGRVAVPSASVQSVIPAQPLDPAPSEAAHVIAQLQGQITALRGQLDEHCVLLQREQSQSGVDMGVLLHMMSDVLTNLKTLPSEIRGVLAQPHRAEAPAVQSHHSYSVQGGLNESVQRARTPPPPQVLSPPEKIPSPQSHPPLPSSAVAPSVRPDSPRTRSISTRAQITPPQTGPCQEQQAPTPANNGRKAQVQRERQEVEESRRQQRTQQFYSTAPRPVRVVFINESTGQEEHHKFDVVPPVNLRRTLDAVKSTMKVNMAKAVVCLQSKGMDPVVIDVTRDERRVITSTEILYIAFLK